MLEILVAPATLEIRAMQDTMGRVEMQEVPEARAILDHQEILGLRGIREIMELEVMEVLAELSAQQLSAQDLAIEYLGHSTMVKSFILQSAVVMQVILELPDLVDLEVQAVVEEILAK
jgi:hypothetical protein